MINNNNLINNLITICSRAIITYLADKYLPQDNEIYPHELITRAQINAALYFDLVVLYGPLHSYVVSKGHFNRGGGGYVPPL